MCIHLEISSDIHQNKVCLCNLLTDSLKCSIHRGTERKDMKNLFLVELDTITIPDESFSNHEQANT